MAEMAVHMECWVSKCHIHPVKLTADKDSCWEAGERRRENTVRRGRFVWRPTYNSVELRCLINVASLFNKGIQQEFWWDNQISTLENCSFSTAKEGAFIQPIVLMMDYMPLLVKIQYIRDQILTSSWEFCKLCFLHESVQQWWMLGICFLTLSYPGLRTYAFSAQLHSHTQ